MSTAEDLPNIAATRDVEPAQLKRALRGDLDWIAMKALEKDRTRRYETANGFAADILAAPGARAGGGGAAQPGRTGCGSSSRKHRGAVIAASLVLADALGRVGRRGGGANSGQRPAHQVTRGGAGAVRPGGGRHQDVPHGRQRGLPAQGGQIQEPARFAAEIGVGILR